MLRWRLTLITCKYATIQSAFPCWQYTQLLYLCTFWISAYLWNRYYNKRKCRFLNQAPKQVLGAKYLLPEIVKKIDKHALSALFVFVATYMCLQSTLTEIVTYKRRIIRQNAVHKIWPHFVTHRDYNTLPQCAETIECVRVGFTWIQRPIREIFCPQALPHWNMMRLRIY